MIALTPAAVAAELGIKTDGVYRLISDGRLRAVNLSPAGSRRPTWRIPRAALEAFLNGGVQPDVDRKRRRRIPAGEVPDYFS